ncbi:hypothetical protein GRI97_04170 [Altererythrobacter xixiisoli]|uniref:DUF3298 domain-containing protein n=1 Tax=Croceibacterium xixiisoli TaxID=1476466 RepID=A0A6I4TST3_9SPHN|nr:hypothetical protein [Croceibacterium xixiisoli]MXO98181.1 hypothetical protein [Croceibacterium xixiisoli]
MRRGAVIGLGAVALLAVGVAGSGVLGFGMAGSDEASPTAASSASAKPALASSAAAEPAAAGPAAAQDQTGKVWQGKIGNLPVRVCFDGEGSDGRGAYYYTSQLRPIGLNAGEQSGQWTERVNYKDSDATWQIAEITDRHLRGTWRQGSKQLPIDLQAVAWTAAEWSGPCSSDAFLSARMVAPRFADAPKRLGNWAYTERVYQPPAHYTSADLAGFTYAPSRPGDRAILSALAAYLPSGKSSDDYVQCLSGALQPSGTDGDYARTVEPILANDNFLTIAISTSADCGGAHPSMWSEHKSFDRQSGEEINLAGWIGGDRPHDGAATLPRPLRAAVMAQWQGEEECREFVENADYWDIALETRGMVFTPVVPHVATPCAEGQLLGWGALAPFLTPDGKAGQARLKS